MIIDDVTFATLRVLLSSSGASGLKADFLKWLVTAREYYCCSVTVTLARRGIFFSFFLNRLCHLNEFLPVRLGLLLGHIQLGLAL